MSTTRRESGFSFIEALIALAILLGAMAIAFMFFVDFGEAINTESSTLASQQAGRVVVDELTRYVRQVGFGIMRADEYNASTWQQAVIHAGSHVLAFNADIDGAIGGIPASESISFPTGPAYVGEAIGATQNGAETYVYTIDADGNNAIELADRKDALSGSYNPAADTANPMDFALFRRIYGFNGTDYGGAMEPLAPHLFTNGTADITYPEDGTSPDPLFTYWMTEDLNRDGILSPTECVNDAVDTCPPATTRAPLLYLWGDTDFDGTLSESEKTALRAMEVGSTAWSKNIFASGGVYKSTTLSVAVDPGALDAFELKIANGAVLGPGYHIQVGTGSGAETFLVDQVSTASTPNMALLSTKPEKVHGTGDIVRVLPSTTLRAIRTIGIAYTSITDRKDSSNGEAAAGRSGRVGTGGLDFRVASYHRNVEVINAPTAASVNDASSISSSICPLQIVNFCSMSPTEQATIYTSPVQAQDLKFLVTDLMGNPIPDITVMFDNSAGWIGSLSQGEALSDSNGLVTVGYTPSGMLGTDLIEAGVQCIASGGVVVEDAATNTINTHEISTTVITDCLSTVSSRTPAPSTDFTVQVLMETGVVTAQDIVFDLEFVGEYLPETPDFTSLVGELTLGGTSAGMTSGEGKLLDVATTTDSNGQVLGSVGMVSDFDGKGAGLRLSATAPADLCSGVDGMAESRVKFFHLSLDSTVPNPGCTEFLPCTIGESSPAPKVRAELTINDTPIQNATLFFTNTDINPPTDGTDTGASLLLPGPEKDTDENGRAIVIVANNGSPLITPETPLLTHVDVTGTAVPTLCGNAAIASSSNKAGFLFEAPTNLCGASLQQSFVVREKNDEICLNILNDAEADGCAMEVKGVRITIYQSDGITPDSTSGSIVKKMEGGGVSSSASCSGSDSVRLFEDRCRIPKDKLPNGESWIFTDYDSCSEPYLFVDPLQFFSIEKIQFDDDYPVSKDMDVTVYYECQGDCDTDSTDSATFRLTTP